MNRLVAALRRLFDRAAAVPADEADREDERKRIVEIMLMGRSCCG